MVESPQPEESPSPRAPSSPAPSSPAQSSPSANDDRLDRIATRWSLVQRAGDDAQTTAGHARRELVLRYSTAIRRYVQGIIRDEAAADEVAQDAVVRMLQGDFSGADPRRGRFRDLLKTAVRNMVRNRWRREGLRRGAPLDVEQLDAPPQESQEPELDQAWIASWRKSTLELTWSALQQHQQQTKGSLDYTLLKLRSEHPDDSSEQLARRLAEHAGAAVRADAVRQKLRRARRRFAELLVTEVADGLDRPTADAVEEELIALGLREHVRDILPSDWKDKFPTESPSPSE
ncbi:MAG: sigma factor [Pirellulaceae bacterium]